MNCPVSILSFDVCASTLQDGADRRQREAVQQSMRRQCGIYTTTPCSSVTHAVNVNAVDPSCASIQLIASNRLPAMLLCSRRGAANNPLYASAHSPCSLQPLRTSPVVVRTVGSERLWQFIDCLTPRGSVLSLIHI